MTLFLISSPFIHIQVVACSFQKTVFFLFKQSSPSTHAPDIHSALSVCCTFCCFGFFFPSVPLYLPQPISKWMHVYHGLSFDTLDILINSCPKLLLANQIFTFSKDFASDLFSKVKCTKLTLTFRENGWKTKRGGKRYKLRGSWRLQA